MIVTVMMMLLALIGADFRRKEAPLSTPVVPKKKCLGYTIIEFGKAVDCNGDTIRLIKVRGGQELARALQAESVAP